MLGMRAVTDDDKALLDIESRFWRYSGSKEAHIAEVLGISGIRYYQRLNQLIDTEDAAAYNPVLVNRLRRLRSDRQRY